MKYPFSLVALFVVAGCGSPSSPTQAGPSAAAQPAATNTLHQAVSTYIQAHASAFPGYEAVRWSPPTAYTKMNEAAIKGFVAMKAFDDALIPRNQALAEYKNSLARHDAPAKTAAIMARYGKANKYNDSLLAIANAFIGVKDTARLGTGVVHTYRAKNESGALVLDSATFVVHRNGQIEQL